jgi:hypothetical protein
MHSVTTELGSDWNVPRHHLSGRERTHLTLLALAAGAVLVAFALVGHPIAAAVLAAAGAGLVVFGGAAALRASGAVAADPEQHARLANIVNGVAATMKVHAPAIRIIPRGEPNALVVRTRRPVIAVAESMLQSFNRTELEAVVAHCMVRIAGPHKWLLATAVTAGPATRGLRPWVGTDDDVRAAALTRYPPALASAIAKSDAARGRFAPLYFVSDHPSHVPAAERLAALSDL